jgi:glycosyltransferase involved in cell wall biosynthesis
VIPPLIPFHPPSGPRSSLKEKYGYREDEQVVLSLGSIKKIKGSDLLLEAFFLLGEEEVERRRARLLLVGDGPMRGELEVEVRKRGFERWVRFLGLLPRDQIPDAFGLADIYVIPSLAEGAPLSLMEAMSNGLPVIGSDIGSIRQFIREGENGLLFRVGNPLALREKLAVLLADHELRKRLSDAARKSAEEGLRFEDVVKRHIALYEGIAGSD